MIIQKNIATGGQYCIFQKGKDLFRADRSYVPFTGMETMIFPCDKKGQVTSWSEVYCDRSGKSLIDCVKEFLAD